MAILIAGQWVSQIGNDVYGLALPWLVYSLYHSTTILGVTGGVAEAAALVSIVSGVFVDRWDRRRTMMAADVVRGLACVGLFFMALTLSGSLAVLLALVVVLRLAGTFFGGASWALMPKLVADEDLPRASGAMSSALTSGGLLGMSLGGVIIGTVGAAGAFLADGISFLGSVVSLAFVRSEASPPPAKIRHVQEVWEELKVGQGVIWKNRFLSRLVVVGVVLGLFSYAVMTLDVVWIRAILQGSSLDYAAFVVAAGLGQILGGLTVSHLMPRVSARNLNALTIALAGLCIAALSRLPFLLPDLGLMFLWGVAVDLQSVSLNVTIQRAIPNEMLGRVGGALGALSASTVPLGMLLAGLGASITSVPSVLLVAGLGMAAVGAAIPFFLPTTPAPPAGALATEA